mmetsp:Transcript_3677/g.7490  ORF Transcript_3677/g.7490 Transcript_3677/m.7490 type:complete len:446 (-) Transcript_3677:1092-2429(-)
MSNAQDLLSILGGGAIRSGGRGATTSVNEKSILTFKAGKMTTELRPNGKYLVTPDTRRGEINLVWSTAAATGRTSNNNNNSNGGHLKVEWRDRRTHAVVNTINVFPEDDATFERVETGKEEDRVYLLQCGQGHESRHFFWMQDKDSEPDEDLCVKVNLYMSDAAEAALAAGVPAPSSSNIETAGSDAAADSSESMDNAELIRIMQGALGSQGLRDGEGGRTTAVPGDSTVPTALPGQVDALGNILENLGIPQPGGTTPAGEHRAAAPAPSGGGLTLADLQGAMAGLATASPPSSAAASPPGPPLSELASSEVIDESGILDDADVRARLISLLPEGQRTEDKLRENIRSPQVVQCLQRLTAALVDDASSFNSIIANFQLNPADGNTAMAAGNPIEAFLNCLLKDVERKEGVKKPKEGDDEAKDAGSGNGTDEEKDGGDGDTKMDEN